MDHKQIVVVLGMHRSGTSAITRGLKVLGVDLGDDLLPAESGNNEKGFFEDATITAYNEELLAALGHAWDSLVPISAEELESSITHTHKVRATEHLRGKIADIKCFGVKDPRMARLLPFWQEIFVELGLSVSYVVAFRNPKNVAHSLVKRNEFEVEKGYFLWLEHMLFSLKYSQGASRIFVNYELMLKEPERQLRRISKSLGLPFDPLGQEFQEYHKQFLQHSLQHNSFTLDELRKDPCVPADVLTLSSLLLHLSRDERADDQTVVATVNKLYQAMVERLPAYRLMRRFDENSTDLSAQLSQKEKKLEMLLADHNALAVDYGKLETSHAQLQEDYLKLSEYRHWLETQYDSFKSTISESEGSVQSLEEDLHRYSSGRFLVKSLISHIGEHLGLRYRGDNPAESELFDADYYLTTYPDVRAAGVNPLQHYLEQGWREGRDPSAGFSTKAYLEHYPDVRLRRINPLIHYLRYGYYEGRSIFDAQGRNYRLSRKVTRYRVAVQLLNLVSQQPELLGRFVREARRGGLPHAMAIAVRKLKRNQKRFELSRVREPLTDGILTEYEVLKVVPYYLDPYLPETPKAVSEMVAVHLHIVGEQVSDSWLGYLGNIPVEFDLYVSCSGVSESKFNEKRLRAVLPLMRELTVEGVPAHAGAVAALIVQFGNRLKEYDVVAHLHDDANVTGTLDGLGVIERLELICGSPANVGQILHLLGGDAKVVYPVDNRRESAFDQTGWTDTGNVLAKIKDKCSTADGVVLPIAQLPRVGPFWARSGVISDLLQLPLQYKHFENDTALAGRDMLSRTLERLVLVDSTDTEGRNYQLEAPQISFEARDYCEPQVDYSSSIKHDTVKVLAYYLPQFHPTPENDEWHGIGFTEWYKVRSANPLFYGHYQQHVPHDDIGYYHLEGPAQLAQQAEMMQKSGVHGLIFYHYWFTGRMILEKPAQMLVDNPQINMPFAFCWANENWTRRWDGNEQEILLGQVYSKEDARGFIRYLIPFFKDERYIKVDGRPMLHVYRPSSIEHIEEYLEVWREECESAGLKAPYMVATLTRGATHPQHHGMDAAVERVLHDWTADAVQDTRNQLRPYWPLEGSVLNYDEVADHYMGQDLGKEFTLFRSLVPTWDNTARYGTRAYVLNNFTTAKFQSWMEYLIEYSEHNLPEDRRYVVVNAWNEWAEGAHLEPDTRFGYGYLNSIGRALSGQQFSATSHFEPGADLTLNIMLTPDVVGRLKVEPEPRRKFLACLTHSMLAQGCSITVDDAELLRALQARGVKCSGTGTVNADFNLVFNDVCLFPVATVGSLLKMAMRHSGFAISANLRNDPSYLQSDKVANFSISDDQRGCMELVPTGPRIGKKVCCESSCFRMLAEVGEPDDAPDIVTTIMRYHRRADRTSLINALLSLIAQTGCRVKPLLAIQDMSDDETELLEGELAMLPWSMDCEPLIRRYTSTAETPDLRSLMLNDALKAAASGYAAFLDYDDLLFPDAYGVLLQQLKASGKNATFGRVYSTMVDAATNCVLKREKIYDYGDSYIDFVQHNHAPLHSFLLDLDKCNLDAVQFYDDMKYMEDYYLTMQLFTAKDTDWASLRTCGFIGDYIHRVGCDSHTLAITDEQQRVDLLSNEAYRVCEDRIKAMRDRLLAKV